VGLVSVVAAVDISDDGREQLRAIGFSNF